MIDKAGATIVDSLDTLYIMGLEDELKDARAWVESELSFDRDAAGSVFEVKGRLPFWCSWLSLFLFFFPFPSSSSRVPATLNNSRITGVLI